jgi:hypothetical protein
MYDTSQNPNTYGRTVSSLVAALALVVTLAGGSLAHATTSTFNFPFPFPGWPMRPAAATIEELPKLDLDPSRITVSGVSSGGFMAVQLHVAYSSVFNGAASLAGGIYECSKGDVGRSQNVCMSGPQNIVAKDHVEIAKARALAGEIDDLNNIANDRVAVFSSPKDLVIKPVASDKLVEFYEALVSKPSITRLTNPDAAHGFPTLGYGNQCSMMGSPWLLKCNDDVAGKVLAAIEPASRAMTARGAQDLSNLIYFDQSKLLPATSRMYGWGAAYIPKACRTASAKCGLHVALHGCQMNPDFIQKQFVENAGYNEWAETNSMVVLYPQSAKGTGNPYGCWDWFGFSGANYTTKTGAQMQAVRTLMTAIGVK